MISLSQIIINWDVFRLVPTCKVYLKIYKYKFVVMWWVSYIHCTFITNTVRLLLTLALETTREKWVINMIIWSWLDICNGRCTRCNRDMRPKWWHWGSSMLLINTTNRKTFLLIWGRKLKPRDWSRTEYCVTRETLTIKTIHVEGQLPFTTVVTKTPMLEKSTPIVF